MLPDCIPILLLASLLLQLRFGTLETASGAKAFYEVLMPQLLARDFSTAADEKKAQRRWEVLRGPNSMIDTVTVCYEALLADVGLDPKQCEQVRRRLNSTLANVPFTLSSCLSRSCANLRGCNSRQQG
eukprot:SAG11_NODE_8400_length_1020_cov_1.621064_3_plen_127_part_01